MFEFWINLFVVYLIGLVVFCIVAFLATTEKNKPNMSLGDILLYPVILVLLLVNICLMMRNR